MTPNVRIYESEQAADAAAARLAEAGFRDYRALHPGSLAGKEVEAVRSASRDGLLPKDRVNAYARQLEQGRSLVAVKAPFRRGVEAIRLLGGDGTVDDDALSPHAPSDPSPLSDVLGLPTLTDSEPKAKLASSSWTLSGLFGFSLLSDDPTPLSSRFGLTVLKATERPWDKSFGQPLLSDDPAPLSSRLGMKTLTGPKRPWESSFGLPLLSANPAPLSTMLGLKILSKSR